MSACLALGLRRISSSYLMLFCCLPSSWALLPLFLPSSYPTLFFIALRAHARRNAPPRFAFAASSCSGPRSSAPRQRGFRLASFYLPSWLRLTCVLVGARLRLAAVGHITLRVSSFAPRQPLSCNLILHSVLRRFFTRAFRSIQETNEFILYCHHSHGPQQ